MNQKTILSMIVSISLITLAACATSTPQQAVSPIAVEDTAIPTVAPSVEARATTPVQEVSTPTSMDPSLECSGSKTSASAIVELTEGPYYTANSPERTSLYEEGMAGTKLTVTGYVYDTNCQPIANAWLDFWQADANGTYDNNGYTLRGHQYTDSNGRYELVTVVPGIYPGRTEHIHFKVQAPNGKVITSQLFFPGVTQNDSDGIYDASLLISIQETSEGLLGQYNFIIPAQ